MKRPRQLGEIDEPNWMGRRYVNHSISSRPESTKKWPCMLRKRGRGIRNVSLFSTPMEYDSEGMFSGNPTALGVRDQIVTPIAS